MSRKTSGLGRGLGDLLVDNTPEMKSASVIRRDEDGEVNVTNDEAQIAEIKELAEKGERSVLEGEQLSLQDNDIAAVTQAHKSPDAQVTSEVSSVAQTPKKTDEHTAVEVQRTSEATALGAKTVEKVSEMGQGEPEGETAKPLYEEHHPHRSLKALFRSYK
ncbi:MAG: hypothetical protein IJ011_04860 [Clostridia bacterium]|nr:hypothetical protein [Clostridia bacterium]